MLSNFILFFLFQALVTKVLNVLVDLCSKGFITHSCKVEKIFKLTTHRKSLAFFQRRGKEPLWPFVFSGKTIGLLAQLVPLVGNAKIECALELIYNFSRHNSLEKKFQVQRNFIPLIYWFVCCPSFSLHRALKTIKRHLLTFSNFLLEHFEHFQTHLLIKMLFTQVVGTSLVGF